MLTNDDEVFCKNQLESKIRYEKKMSEQIKSYTLNCNKLHHHSMLYNNLSFYCNCEKNISELGRKCKSNAGIDVFKKDCESKRIS